METLTANAAGAPAYKLSDKAALAQLVMTGVIGNACDLSFKEDAFIKNVIQYCDRIDASFISKLAFYAHHYGSMKDTPVLLVAYLALQRDAATFNKTFDAVIGEAQHVRRFVGYIRSGVIANRKSLGTVSKKAVQRWFAHQTPEKLYWQNIGQKPSLGDVIKLAHPKPANEAENAMYAHFIGKQLPEEFTPAKVKLLEDFRKDMSLPVPNVPFLKLTSLPLKSEHWKQIARNMTWNQLRLNLNTLQRHGVFEDSELTDFIAAKLALLGSEGAQLPVHVLPFSVYNTYENLDSIIPQKIKNAVFAGVLASLRNTPKFDNEVIIAVDVSGSMSNQIHPKSTLSFAKAAAFFATGLYQNNPDKVKLITFNGEAQWYRGHTSFHSMYTHLSSTSGGTNVSSCLKLANNYHETAPLFIILSDNQSWMGNVFGEHTSAKLEWAKYNQQTTTKNGKPSKLICWDLSPSITTQIQTDSNVLNIGGYTDNVFQVIKYFNDFESPEKWTDLIENLNPFED